MTELETCEGVAGNRPCGGDGAVQVTVMCVHEHRLEPSLCQWHQQMAADGLGYCGDCGNAGHECPMSLLTSVPP